MKGKLPSLDDATYVLKLLTLGKKVSRIWKTKFLQNYFHGNRNATKCMELYFHVWTEIIISISDTLD